MVSLNASDIFNEQLAHSMGLDQYAKIIRGDPADPVFQRSFNYYYRVRRNEDWRTTYYSLFSIAKNERWTFEQIITELYKKTGNIESSFSSKMLATIDPGRPIWDQYVLRNLGFALTGKTPADKLKNAIKIYSEIESWYTAYLETEEARKSIKVFDQFLPNYTWLSPTKKIDCLLWGKRN